MRGSIATTSLCPAQVADCAAGQAPTPAASPPTTNTRPTRASHLAIADPRGDRIVDVRPDLSEGTRRPVPLGRDVPPLAIGSGWVAVVWLVVVGSTVGMTACVGC